MKRTGYYFLIAIESLALVAGMILQFLYPAVFADCWPMLLCTVLGVPLLSFMCLGIEYRNRAASLALPSADSPKNTTTPAPDGKDEGENMPSATDQAQDECPKEEAPAQDEESVSLTDKWNKAMYERYNGQWDELFRHIERPLTPAAKAQLSLLLWEIASQTVNYLKEANSDINKVGYNADGVRMITENLTLDDIELKKFYVDPTTVSVNAIAVYEWLQEQGVQADTSAFGYRLKIQQQ